MNRSTAICNYREAIADDAVLALFLSALRDFDTAFCNAMVSGTDFTLKLEIHGNDHCLLHARINTDTFRRPAGADKKAEAKNSRNSV
jgi:hypothetical protein